MNTWQQAIETLSPQDWQELQVLNTKIQSNKAPWGETTEPIEVSEGRYEAGYVSHSALLTEFVKTWYDKNLVIAFDWPEWQEGKEWLSLQEESKFDTLDDETSLKLITAIIRNDRFNDGILMHYFEQGDIQKIVNRFIKNHELK